MKILFCPAHYFYDDTREGSELSWAYNIADRIGTEFPGSVVVTGRSIVQARPYRIVELTPWENRLNFGLRHAFMFNARYSNAANRALTHERFDVLHHVLPFAVGKTHNVAALRHRVVTPYVIGPVQPPVVRDTDIDPKDLRDFERLTGFAARRRALVNSMASLASDAAPLVFSRISRRTIANASAVVAVNEATKNFLLRAGAAPDRVVVIPPGIDTHRFNVGSSQEASNHVVRILCVSRLLRRKNVDLVVRAFSDVTRTSPRIQLRIVGDGPEREALAKLTRDLGVGERVTLTGFIPNSRVHEEYHRADIFVNASAGEGFATTCLEALASGLPVVTTKVGGFFDAIEDGRNGYLVRADVDDLAAKLGRLTQSKKLIEEFSRHAREVAERRFDWDHVVIPSYVNLYRSVIQEHAGVVSSGQ